MTHIAINEIKLVKFFMETQDMLDKQIKGCDDIVMLQKISSFQDGMEHVRKFIQNNAEPVVTKSVPFHNYGFTIRND
jgi:hypothetical protein